MGCGGVERHLEMGKPTKIVRKLQNGDLKNHTPTIFGSYSLLLKLLAKWKIEKENYSKTESTVLTLDSIKIFGQRCF